MTTRRTTTTTRAGRGARATRAGRSTTTRATGAVAALALVASACGSDGIDEAASDVVDSVEDVTGTVDPDVADSVDDVVSDVVETVDSALDGAGVSSDDDAASGTTRIGIVAPSASNDLAFTQSIVDSVDRLDTDVDVQITDGTFVVEDAAAAIRGYAEDGVDLVIAHGSQYGAPLQEIAPDFPDTSFAWGTSVDTFGLDNVFAYTTRADEGGYVNGVMAAQLTESDTIGVVGPIEVGDAKLYVDGFEAGVAAQDPAVSVTVNYIESFSDVALASEAANALVESGADVLTGTAQMVVGATGVAQEAGIAWFGTQSDQTPLGPDIVVASQVYHWEVVLSEIIDSLASGTVGGETFTLSFENGGLEMEYNDDFDLPADVRTAADEAVAGLVDGSITTGVS
ncbi:BMP family lipoprotein [Ilumatobacter sp.]|uniref:BMP family lipoprotein n=1 Tax=Ilumatobacter sp. TaxID=1967498 RepID=UPI003B5190A0